MSASAQEIDGEGDDAVRNGDDEDVGFDNPRKKKKRRKRSYLEFLGKLARARKVFLCHSILRRSKRKPIRSVDEGARCGQRWLFCISRPGTSDSPVESYPSDPNDPTHEKIGSRIWDDCVRKQSILGT
ncbi:hypothetical protein SAY87_032094 [Trapa incisa]|uniref:Uncharacterized protein n=1 Tax=Trapa incisa TaxID=236973 RepID=A0AAN7KYY8_9MYRT|nr:hypothetical protein SAY87_032094 [Trapa incisa]